jgi:predicted RNA-binding protein with TRAM domain
VEEMPEQQTAVKLNETYEGCVSAIGAKGDPIVRVGGLVVMIKSQNPLIVGDPVKFKVTKVLEKYAFAIEE